MIVRIRPDSDSDIFETDVEVKVYPKDNSVVLTIDVGCGDSERRLKFTLSELRHILNYQGSCNV